jgi:hypothetical protein
MTVDEGPGSNAGNGLGRREFLGATAGALVALGALPEAGAAPSGWNGGSLAHLIPTANHERFLIKASFKSPLKAPPKLSVGGVPFDGVRTDTGGRFYRFDANGLRPGTPYELRLVDASGAPLCDGWRLKTLPAPDTKAERLRLLVYTCAGGYDGPAFQGKTFFLDMALRRRLLARALSFQPDVVIANGDHVYWDLETSQNKPLAKFVQQNHWTKFGGALDTSVPMLHPKNAAIFRALCDYQIAGLYGNALRSTPSFFLTDDHDMFENAEFDAGVATLPPDTYGKVGAEATQALYYPEFLPDPQRPDFLPGGDKAGLPAGTNMTFGTLRYGSLLEAVLYDCRRYLDSSGAHAKLLPGWVEAWILARTRAEDTTHFFHVPSLPFGYTTGKAGEFYPDAFDDKQRRLVPFGDKAGWQRGWFAQHQRLLSGIAAQKSRVPLVVQGDLHASAAGRIVRSGELSLPRPVHVVTAGTLGTGDLAFPSAYRGFPASPSALIGLEPALAPAEKNGFTIVDVTPDKLTFALFTFRPPERAEQIDALRPAIVYEVPRKA